MADSFEKVSWFNRGTTVIQMIVSVATIGMVMVSVYVGAMTRLSNIEHENQNQASHIRKNEERIEKQDDKLDKILEKLTIIQLDLKDKEDRK
ncbi:MAG: hypothetical protein EP332_06325 [Bacteroidetes bacterium]|nr:MAG: hypothetical protein EP332_06325 [Bacteroidota bacterium]